MKHVLTILAVSLLAACGSESKTDSATQPNSATMTEAAKTTFTYP